jgi:hypothetical protein
MTRGQVASLVASTIVGALSAAAVSEGAQTLMRAAASTCVPITGNTTPIVPAGSAITTTEASTGGAGRFAAAAGALKIYCPVPELPTVLPVAVPELVDRVSVLYKTPITDVAASAQVCSEDNAWSFGGSCSSATTRTGAGAGAIDIDLTTKTNWLENPESLHYIFAFIPNISVAGGGGTGGTPAAFFTGYTIWKS